MAKDVKSYTMSNLKNKHFALRRMEWKLYKPREQEYCPKYYSFYIQKKKKGKKDCTI